MKPAVESAANATAAAVAAGVSEAKMDELMAKVIGQQPAANSAPAEAELVIDLAVPGKEDYFIA